MNTATLLALWTDRERADRLGTTRQMPDLLAPSPNDRRGWTDGRWLAFFDRPAPEGNRRAKPARHRRRWRLAG